MAEISTPLIITGFLQGMWEDPSIYSIYTFRHESMSGKEELSFAVFFTPANDMDNPNFNDVAKLYENGAITPQGRAFVVSDWRLVAVTKIKSDSPISIFQNSLGDYISWGYSPIGLDNETVPEQDWPIYTEKDYWDIVQRIEEGDLSAYKALVLKTPPVSGYILLEAPQETPIAEDKLQQIAKQVMDNSDQILKAAGDDAFKALAIKPMGLVLSPPSLTIQFQAPNAGIAKIVEGTYRRSWNEALFGVPDVSADTKENFIHLIYAEAKYPLTTTRDFLRGLEIMETRIAQLTEEIADPGERYLACFTEAMRIREYFRKANEFFPLHSNRALTDQLSNHEQQKTRRTWELASSYAFPPESVEIDNDLLNNIADKMTAEIDAGAYGDTLSDRSTDESKETFEETEIDSLDEEEQQMAEADHEPTEPAAILDERDKVVDTPPNRNTNIQDTDKVKIQNIDEKAPRKKQDSSLELNFQEKLRGIGCSLIVVSIIALIVWFFIDQPPSPEEVSKITDQKRLAAIALGKEKWRFGSKEKQRQAWYAALKKLNNPDDIDKAIKRYTEIYPDSSALKAIVSGTDDINVLAKYACLDLRYRQMSELASERLLPMLTKIKDYKLLALLAADAAGNETRTVAEALVKHNINRIRDIDTRLVIADTLRSDKILDDTIKNISDQNELFKIVQSGRKYSKAARNHAMWQIQDINLIKKVLLDENNDCCREKAAWSIKSSKIPFDNEEMARLVHELTSKPSPAKIGLY